MMNEGSYNFAEIWPFQVHGSGNANESGGALGLREVQFGQNLSQFVTNREVSGEDPASLEHKVVHGNGSRKRCEVEDESPKVVSTSTGNGVVYLFIYLFDCIFSFYSDFIFRTILILLRRGFLYLVT